ncbi:hypothetical protein GNP94_18530 [Paenibacillus campinasensis]|uniref:DUF4304 domain-containing protein n=1 Tax=Paenibacillus campinasensis TaxID=66347 RepID=A0ABW9T530_9BACL|nr:hypothetical protein [Paenibacillus campinasensis]MUG67987.1 hypothetical protein [Paenibacillus campinasensis]
MQKLPRGITGFGRSDSEAAVTEKEFKQLCYQLLMEHGFQTFEMVSTYHHNYYVGELRGDEQFVYVLMNKHYPFVAMATKYEDGNVEFIADNRFNGVAHRERFWNHTTSFNQYVLLRFNVLEALLTDDVTKELDKDELKQIDYWKPVKIKDIVFNHWD